MIIKRIQYAELVERIRIQDPCRDFFIGVRLTESLCSMNQRETTWEMKLSNWILLWFIQRYFILKRLKMIEKLYTKALLYCLLTSLGLKITTKETSGIWCGLPDDSDNTSYSNGGLMSGGLPMDLIRMIMKISKPSDTVTSWKRLYHQILSGLNWPFTRNPLWESWTTVIYNFYMCLGLNK